MDKRTISAIVGGVIALIIIVAILAGGVGKNDAQNWQIIQSVGGKITVRDQAGWYPKWFATVWTFPRYVDKSWNDIEDEGEKTIESIRTTFNDGGTAQVSTYVRYATPISEEARVEFHRQFSGNVENATIAVKSHQINCIKATGPLMSASENQSARKAEFTQLIEAQLSDGLYQMKRMEREVEVEEEEESVRLKQITTELVCDKDGKPLIAKDSPLDFYGIKILQFSVTGTDYDPDTLQQFATKKRSFLAAEQSKADREKEKQERLNIIEKGLREVAEAQAAANVVKEKAVVEAQQKVEVALQTKLEAETTAEMALSVATIAKQEASVKFSKAEIDAKAITVLAQAERERIKLAGALTELEQAKIDAQVQMAIEVSAGLSKIESPSVVIIGGNEDGAGSGDGLMKHLISLKLMADSGLLQITDVSKSVVEREVEREVTTVK